MNKNHLKFLEEFNMEPENVNTDYSSFFNKEDLPHEKNLKDLPYKKNLITFFNNSNQHNYPNTLEEEHNLLISKTIYKYEQSVLDYLKIVQKYENAVDQYNNIEYQEIITKTEKLITKYKKLISKSIKLEQNFNL